MSAAKKCIRLLSVVSYGMRCIDIMFFNVANIIILQPQGDPSNDPNYAIPVEYIWSACTEPPPVTYTEPWVNSSCSTSMTYCTLRVWWRDSRRSVKSMPWS